MLLIKTHKLANLYFVEEETETLTDDFHVIVKALYTLPPDY